MAKVDQIRLHSLSHLPADLAIHELALQQKEGPQFVESIPNLVPVPWYVRRRLYYGGGSNGTRKLFLLRLRFWDTTTYMLVVRANIGAVLIHDSRLLNFTRARAICQ